VSRTDQFTHDVVACWAPGAIALWHTGAGEDTTRLEGAADLEAIVALARELTVSRAKDPSTVAIATTPRRARRDTTVEAMW
jgi:hypothetical protein